MLWTIYEKALGSAIPICGCSRPISMDRGHTSMQFHVPFTTRSKRGLDTIIHEKGSGSPRIGAVPEGHRLNQWISTEKR